MNFSEVLLKKIAADVLQMINDNIKKGVDYEGNSYSYSEKRFYIPYTPDIKRKLAGKLKAGLAQNIFNFVSKKDGGRGLVVNGYRSFKNFVYPNASKYYLTVSGKMLRNMNVLSMQDNTIVIGFSQQEQAKKATWFNVTGVGKSRKLWKFLGISQEQKTELEKKYATEFAKEIDAAIKNMLKNCFSKKFV